jgi:hypothetical protein
MLAALTVFGEDGGFAIFAIALVIAALVLFILNQFFDLLGRRPPR